MLNLLSNAIKFSEANSTIRIQSELVEISAESMAIFVSVKDTGIGISKKEMDKLFKPYFKSSES